MSIIKVVIADDHRMVREGLKQLLELDGNIKIVGQANDGLECLETVEALSPDVLLLDINMPKMSGLAVLEELKERKIEQKTLMLTIHNEVEYLMKAIEIGVNGYVLKDADSESLKKAIYSVYNDEMYIEPSMALMLKERKSKGRLSGDDSLTRREIEVLKLVAEGLFNKEIAYKLSISEKTVKNHVSNIFKKINVSDRTQAAVYAIKNSYVDFLV